MSEPEVEAEFADLEVHAAVVEGESGLVLVKEVVPLDNVVTSARAAWVDNELADELDEKLAGTKCTR